MVRSCAKKNVWRTESCHQVATERRLDVQRGAARIDFVNACVQRAMQTAWRQEGNVPLRNPADRGLCLVAGVLERHFMVGAR